MITNSESQDAKLAFLPEWWLSFRGIIFGKSTVELYQQSFATFDLSAGVRLPALIISHVKQVK